VRRTALVFLCFALLGRHYYGCVSRHAGRFPFGPCLACLELSSRSHRHFSLLIGFRCLAVGSRPVVGIIFLGLVQGASFGLAGGCELCAPACASFIF
jgi:hypothetical protein